MQIAQSRILVTGRKSDLELPAHLLVDRISEQVPKGSLSIRRHIKGLIGINTRHLGRGDVSYSIAASFPNGDIILVQFGPQFRGSVQANIVDLDILSGRNMEPAGRILFRNLTDPKQLFSTYSAVRQLDPDHLDTGLPLPIDSPGQPEAFEFIFINLAVLE